MLDRPARATTSQPKDRTPAAALGDVDLVTFNSDATFRRARQEWLRDIMRQGDFQVLAVCFALSSYLGFKSGGVAWVDQHRLAADLNCDVRTVGRRIRDAVEQGWLRTQRRANNTSTYRMARSRSVLASVELGYENRMAEFTVESARRRLARDARGSDIPVGSVQTDLSETFGQECPFGSDRYVGLSSGIPTAGDPDRRSPERLGEGVPDIEGDEVEQKKMAREQVIVALGDAADRVPKAKLDKLADRAARFGMIEIAGEIRHAAETARGQRLSH